MKAAARIRVPTKAEIERLVTAAITAARAAGIDVAGFEMQPDGVIRILEPRGANRVENDFDRWADKL